MNTPHINVQGLKPCPSCGDAMPAVTRVGKCHAVECGCGVTGPYCNEPIEAIAAWNALPRRADIERAELERDWLADELAAYCNAQCQDAYKANGSFCRMRNGKCKFSFSECKDVTRQKWIEKAADYASCRFCE